MSGRELSELRARARLDGMGVWRRNPLGSNGPLLGLRGIKAVCILHRYGGSYSTGYAGELRSCKSILASLTTHSICSTSGDQTRDPSAPPSLTAPFRFVCSPVKTGSRATRCVLHDSSVATGSHTSAEPEVFTYSPTPEPSPFCHRPASEGLGHGSQPY